MLGRQLQVGERTHAIQSRRLQEEDIMATCIRHILQVRLALHICAMRLPKTGSIFEQNDDERHHENVNMSSKMQAIEHIMANEASKEGT